VVGVIIQVQERIRRRPLVNTYSLQDRERVYTRAAALCVIAVACLLSGAGPLYAEGNIHLGQLRIHPFAMVSESTSDNIFNTATNTRKDSITTYTPGVKLEREFGKHQVEAVYSSVINRHHRYSGENTTDQNANGLVDFKIGSRFGFQLSDVYVKRHEDRGYSATGVIEKFKNNTGTVSATYQLADRSKIQLDASKSAWDFNSSIFRDRDEAFFSAYLYYRFLPKTSAFIEIDRKNVVFSDPTLELNNSVLSGYIGLRWEMTAKSKGVIKGGALKKDFKSPLLEDHDSWSGAIDLHHAFSEYTNIAVKGERIVHEANVLGNRYVVTTGAFVEFSHRFLQRLGVSVRGTYGLNQFSDPIPPDTIVRMDRTAIVGGGLKYFFRDWLNFGVDYKTRTRRSNLPVNDFKEHVTMVMATMTL
jgi:hypothetical protein